MKKENGISEPCKASEDTKNKARTFDDVSRDSAQQQKCMRISPDQSLTVTLKITVFIYCVVLIKKRSRDLIIR